MADVALWLGPYMSISSKTPFVQGPKRPGNAGKSQQTNITQTSQTTRKSPARLAFRQKKQHAKRARAQTKTPIKGFAIGHSGLTTASHSVPVGVLWCCGFVLAFGGCCFSFLCSFARFCSCWLGCFGLARSLLAASTLVLPTPRLVLWCLLVQSVFCWSLPPRIWLYLQLPGCHPVDGLAPVFTSPHGNKGFGVLLHVAGVVQVLVSEDCSGFHG